MRKTMILLVLLLATSVNASKKTSVDDCLDIEGSIVSSMVNAMDHDLNIPESSIILNKTKLTLISETLINDKLADQFARKYLESNKNSVITLTELKKIYTGDNTKNLIIKYEFENKEGKKAIFIGSALINDNECSVSFPGYITVKREF